MVKLQLDPTYVGGAGSQIGNPAIVNALASLNPCYNNTNYSCVSVPNSILGKIYAVGDDATGKENIEHLRKNANKLSTYNLDERITNIKGSNIILETRGKKTSFTVTLPYDAVSAYNKTAALKVQLGDLISITYNQKPSENHLAIHPGDLEAFMLLEQTQPDGSLAKY